MPLSKQKLKDESATALKEATPVGGGYAGFFSLQAGTVITSTCIFSMALITFFYNLSAPNDSYEPHEYNTQYALVYSYVGLTFIGTGIVSTFAFKKNPKWLLFGSILVTFSSAYWFVMALLSFFPSPSIFNYLCIMDRCPPTHWIFEVPWRNSSNQTDEENDFNRHQNYTPSDENGQINDTTTTQDPKNGTTDDHHGKTMLTIQLNPTLQNSPSVTLVDNCDKPATISNEFINKESNNLKVIEGMKKLSPSNIEDDANDEDTKLDNALYDDKDAPQKPNRFFVPHGDRTVTESEAYITTSAAITTSITTSSTDQQQTDGQLPTSSSMNDTKIEEKTTLSDEVAVRSLLQRNTNRANNNNDNRYPEVTKVPPKVQRLRNLQWKLQSFMSSAVVAYTSDMYGGNVAMSVISFIVFTVFLIYGLVCMFCMYKRLKRLEREREEEDEDEEEEPVRYVSKMSSHPSRRSQTHSQTER